MKIRIGFVSNSSSSSYILALSKGKKCDHCNCSDIDMLELVGKLFSKKEWVGNIPSTYNGDPTVFVDLIDGEIEQLDKDIEWVTKKIEVLKDLSKNDDALTIFGNWYDISKNVNPRWRRDIDERCDETPRDKLKREAESLGRLIQENRSKRSSLEIKKNKLEDAVTACQTIYVFDIDHIGKERDIIETLIKNGVVDVIERIVT